MTALARDVLQKVANTHEVLKDYGAEITVSDDTLGVQFSPVETLIIESEAGVVDALCGLVSRKLDRTLGGDYGVSLSRVIEEKSS